MNLSEKIYTARKKAGLSQETLAQRIGVSRQAVSKWETGEAVPELSKLAALARELGVSADWLLAIEVETEDTSPSSEVPSSGYPVWLEHLPDSLLRLFRRFG